MQAHVFAVSVTWPIWLKLELGIPRVTVIQILMSIWKSIFVSWHSEGSHELCHQGHPWLSPKYPNSSLGFNGTCLQIQHHTNLVGCEVSQ